MSTRDSMRRELRELAKLAETKRQERQEQSKSARSSGEWSYADLASEAATPPPPPEKADEAVLASTDRRIESLDPPSWPSSATVPPVVPGGSPSVPSEFEAPLSPTPGPRRIGRWLLVGAAAVVLVGAGLVGRRLHGASAATAAASPPPAVAEAAAAAAPAPAAAEAPPAAPDPQPAAAPPAPPPSPAPVAASPSRHSGGAHSWKATSRPALAKAAAQAKTAAPPAAASKSDSLDDMMRKAVNSK
jgi:hypothetical protein